MSALKNIPKSKLEIGGLYQNHKQHKAIFLGHVDTVKYLKNKLEKYSFTKTTYDNALLFYDFNKRFSVSKLKDIMLANNIEDIFNYQIRKTHNYIEKISQYK